MLERLSEKTHRVLYSVVRDYIRTAHPVGSVRVARKYRLGMSPATVRNILADLEEMGFLEQPYTSSGRVPTDRAFRYYVDKALETRPLKRSDREMIQEAYQFVAPDVSEILQETSRILSQVSRYPSVVSAPRVSHHIFEKIDLVRLDGSRILMILISQGGVIHNRILAVETQWSQKELSRAAEYLSNLMKGMTLSEVKKKILEDLRLEKDQYERILYRIFNGGRKFLEEDAADVYIDGQSHILQYPEFSEDIEKLKGLWEAFEEKHLLLQLLDKAMEVEGTRVYIGAENEVGSMEACSLVATTYCRSGTPLGTIGVIGPKRMDYSRVIPIVQYTARVVGNKLQEIGA